MRSLALGVAGVSALRSANAQPKGASLPVTGVADPALEPFDRLMTSFVEENRVPGAALAVTYHGSLVYARGFGYSDTAKKEPVEPTALFRIASVSKPLTAVAVMQLVEAGKIELDDTVQSRMKLSPFVAPGGKADPRWKQITIRQCLQHTGGWDREKSYDPIGRPHEIAKALGIPLPVKPAPIVRYMMGQPLDFTPGERYAYSNLGYLILGRVIEAASGRTYEPYVREKILTPLGLRAPKLGRALLRNRAKGEVRYYDAKNRTGQSLYPPLGQQVPIPYGGENLEGFEAHGGWIASAVDLVKFASAFDDPNQCPLLSAKTIDEMWARPAGAAGTDSEGKPKAAFYGCGWNVRPVGNNGKLNAWHIGQITGSESLLVRRFDGLTWAVLFNTDHNADGKLLSASIDGKVHEAADAVKSWPEEDQFKTLLE